MNVHAVSISPQADRQFSVLPNNYFVKQTPAPKDGATRAAAGTPTLQEVRQAVNTLNAAMRSLTSQLVFFIDEKTGGVVVKVVDTKTNQVIREFTAGKVLGAANAVGEMAHGLLFHEST